MFARIFKYCELSWPALTELKAWLRKSTTFNTFDMSMFANPALRVATATDASGNTIAYCPVESCFLISAYAVNPKATEAEATLAGDEIDAMLESEGQRAGISKCLIVLPPNHPGLPLDEFREVRVYERRIPLGVRSGGIPCYNQTQATHFLN